MRYQDTARSRLPRSFSLPTEVAAMLDRMAADDRRSKTETLCILIEGEASRRKLPAATQHSQPEAVA